MMRGTELTAAAFRRIRIFRKLKSKKALKKSLPKTLIFDRF